MNHLLLDVGSTIKQGFIECPLCASHRAGTPAMQRQDTPQRGKRKPTNQTWFTGSCEAELLSPALGTMWLVSLSFVFDVLILRADLTLEALLILCFRDLEAEWGLNPSLLVVSRRVLPKGIHQLLPRGGWGSECGFLPSVAC